MLCRTSNSEVLLELDEEGPQHWQIGVDVILCGCGMHGNALSLGQWGVTKKSDKFQVGISG